MRYLVYCKDPRAEGDMMIGGLTGERAIGALCKASQVEADSNTNPLDIGTFITDSAENAAELAKRIAQQRPGWDIYVCKTTHIYSAQTPNVTAKSVSERGVLPV